MRKAGKLNTPSIHIDSFNRLLRGKKKKGGRGGGEKRTTAAPAKSISPDSPPYLYWGGEGEGRRDKVNAFCVILGTSFGIFSLF